MMNARHILGVRRSRRESSPQHKRNNGWVLKTIHPASTCIDRADRGEFKGRAEHPGGPILSARGLEQFHRIPVRILDLDLLAARTRLHVVSEMEAGAAQRRDERWKVGDSKDDTIPSAGLLLLTVRHRTGSRRLRAAQQNLHVAERGTGERRKLLVFEREAEMLRVELD
jgi:hypothetical protein